MAVCRRICSFRFMGPAVGNRISAAAGIPGDPTTYYAGAASGGVWKSTDSGKTWAPIFDNEPVQAIGSLAVAPSDPKIVWAGTGEAWAIRDSDMMGDGIYKSTDAGATWQHMGLAETGRIGRIVDPSHRPQHRLRLRHRPPHRPAAGARRVQDHRRRPHLGARPVRRRQHRLQRPRHGRATIPTRSLPAPGRRRCTPTACTAAAPAALSTSPTMPAPTGRKLEGHGLPHSPVGKIDVAIAPTNSKRVYALIQTADQGSIWRSDDGGETWTNGSWQRALIGRAGYYIHLAVSTSNPDEVLVANSSFWLSTDGGKSFREVPWGGDTHDIWIDPKDSKRILVTHDGGMYMTTDHGATSTTRDPAHRPDLPRGRG